MHALATSLMLSEANNNKVVFRNHKTRSISCHKAKYKSQSKLLFIFSFFFLTKCSVHLFTRAHYFKICSRKTKVSIIGLACKLVYCHGPMCHETHDVSAEVCAKKKKKKMSLLRTETPYLCTACACYVR